MRMSKRLSRLIGAVVLSALGAAAFSGCAGSDGPDVLGVGGSGGGTPDAPPDAKTDATHGGAPLGRACQAKSESVSGFCVGGFCWRSDCTGESPTCSATR